MEVIDCFYEVAFCSFSIYETVIKNALASHKFNNFSSRNSDYLQTVSVVFEDCWFYSSLVACNVLPQHGYWIWLCLSISFYILWNNCQPWSSIPIKIDCVLLGIKHINYENQIWFDKEFTCSHQLQPIVYHKKPLYIKIGWKGYSSAVTK